MATPRFNSSQISIITKCRSTVLRCGPKQGALQDQFSSSFTPSGMMSRLLIKRPGGGGLFSKSFTGVVAFLRGHHTIRRTVRSSLRPLRSRLLQCLSMILLGRYNLDPCNCRRILAPPRSDDTRIVLEFLIALTHGNAHNRSPTRMHRCSSREAYEGMISTSFSSRNDSMIQVQ
jgi:hypothetical protein